MVRKPPKVPRLPDPNGGRSIPEWIGKTPDEKVPEDVQLRVWRRQGGKCAITGIKMRRKSAHLDHKQALSLGGQHRESNLQWVLTEKAHKPKSKEEAGIRAKADRCAKAEAGIKPETSRPIRSAGFAQAPEKARKGDPFPNLPRRICGVIVDD